MNKMSRVIVACSDGGARSGIAAKLVSEAGFSSIVTIEGGIDAYLAVSPLTEKDKKTRISRVTQTDAGAPHIHITLTRACVRVYVCMSAHGDAFAHV